MNKADLVNRVSNFTMSKADAEAAVNAIITSVVETVRNGGEVKIAGFGSFVPREREARTGRNPKTGDAVEIEASRGLAFKPIKALKKL